MTTNTTLASEAAVETVPKKRRKLCIIASKGSLDMAYPPLILANAARMEGVDVDLFFTFWGLDIITKKKMDDLHIATVGNPNMHPWFHIPTMLGGLPGMSAMASQMMKQEIAKLDFPPIPEFVQMIADTGARIFACKMSMDMMRLTKADLVDDAEIIGAMEFIEYSDGAQLLFI
jgi:peroxiredoxin family protein